MRPRAPSLQDSLDSSAPLRQALGFRQLPKLPLAAPALVNDPGRLWRDTKTLRPRYMTKGAAEGLGKLRKARGEGDSPPRRRALGLDVWPELGPGGVPKVVPSLPICLPVDVSLISGVRVLAVSLGNGKAHSKESNFERIADLPSGTLLSPYEMAGEEPLLAGLPSPRGSHVVQPPSEEVLGLRYHLAERCLACAPGGVLPTARESGESGLGDMGTEGPRIRVWPSPSPLVSHVNGRQLARRRRA